MSHFLPKIKPIDKDLNEYDEIFIGTPIWNRKGVPAINAFLADEAVCKKVSGVIMTSASGDVSQCVRALAEKLPNLKYQLSLLNRNHKDHGANGAKIEEFVKAVNG